MDPPLVNSFFAFVAASTPLQDELLALEGRRLASDKALGTPCFVDSRLRMFYRKKREAISSQSAPPPTDARALGEAAERRAKVGVRAVKLDVLGRRTPTRTLGSGDPIFVGSGTTRRLLADGA